MEENPDEDQYANEGEGNPEIEENPDKNWYAKVEGRTGKDNEEEINKNEEDGEKATIAASAAVQKTAAASKSASIGKFTTASTSKSAATSKSATVGIAGIKRKAPEDEDHKVVPMTGSFCSTIQEEEVVISTSKGCFCVSKYTKFIYLND